MSLLRLALFGTAAITVCGAAALWFIAPWLINTVLGNAYADMTPVLRALCLFIPLQACNIVLERQILVPFGQEKARTIVQATVAIFSLPVAALLGNFWGLAGGACLPVLLEGCMMLGFVPFVLRCCPEIVYRPKRSA